VSDKLAADSYSISLYQETGYKAIETDLPHVKKYHANFEVKIGRDGGLYAADMDQGIFCEGMTKDELIHNIHEAVECHFDVPSFEEVEINLRYL